jgi:uncharacterized protein
LINDPTPLRSSWFERLRKDPELLAIIEKSDAVLSALGYTDHGRRHVTLVATNAAKLLARLGYDRKTCDLAAVAGFLHDIGNCAGRVNHASVGASMAFQLLCERGVPDADAADVMAAIANHDETEGGTPVNAPAAALIIADKADIHRSRVRTRHEDAFDIHDKVNHGVVKSELAVEPERKLLRLSLTVDNSVVSDEEVAELFASRFDLCREAARFLGYDFLVEANGKPIR